MRMILAQAGLETRMLLRNGEQLLLTMIIPTLLLVVFSRASVVRPAHGERIDFVAPGVLALAVMSTAFTGQAIATGFDRRYGVLKRLAVSPLPRWGLLAGKTLAVLAVELLQIALLAGIALGLGWSVHGNPLVVALLLLAGTAAFTGLGLLMAGTLRAEATLAAANVIFLLLVVGGGIVAPLSHFGSAGTALRATPSAALSGGLRDVFTGSAGVPWAGLGVLVCWAGAAGGLAARFFRWE